MEGWGLLLIIGVPALAILIGVIVRIFKHPKKVPTLTYGKGKKNDRSKYGKKRNGKSH